LHHVAKVELIKEAFDRLGEESRIVTSLRNVRIAVPWVIERIDREVLGKLRHDLFEEVAGAARLFNRKGFSEVTISEIMTSAGLTHGGFYRHFKSKDEL